jgi:hypothetical protein
VVPLSSPDKIEFLDALFRLSEVFFLLRPKMIELVRRLLGAEHRLVFRTIVRKMRLPRLALFALQRLDDENIRKLLWCNCHKKKKPELHAHLCLLHHLVTSLFESEIFSRKTDSKRFSVLKKLIIKGYKTSCGPMCGTNTCRATICSRLLSCCDELDLVYYYMWRFSAMIHKELALGEFMDALLTNPRKDVFPAVFPRFIKPDPMAQLTIEDAQNIVVCMNKRMDRMMQMYEDGGVVKHIIASLHMERQNWIDIVAQKSFSHGRFDTRLATIIIDYVQPTLCEVVSLGRSGIVALINIHHQYSGDTSGLALTKDIMSMYGNPEELPKLFAADKWKCMDDRTAVMTVITQYYLVEKHKEVTKLLGRLRHRIEQNLSSMMTIMCEFDMWEGQAC